MIGSASYNMLIIASICCFCVYSFKIRLSRRILVKHAAFYALNLLVLIGIFYKNHNSMLQWYDNLVSILVYVVFVFFTLYETQIVEFFRGCLCCGQHQVGEERKEPEESETEPIGVVEAVEAIPRSSLVTDQQRERESTANLMLINKYKLIDLVLADSKNNFNSYQTSIYINDSYNEPYDFFQSYKDIKPLNLSKKFKLLTVLPARIFAYLMIVDFRRFQTRKNFFLTITLITSFVILIACSFILIWFVSKIYVLYTFSMNI